MLSKETTNQLLEAIDQSLDPLRHQVLQGLGGKDPARAASEEDLVKAREVLDQYGRRLVLSVDYIIKKD